MTGFQALAGIVTVVETGEHGAEEVAGGAVGVGTPSDLREGKKTSDETKARF